MNLIQNYRTVLFNILLLLIFPFVMSSFIEANLVLIPFLIAMTAIEIVLDVRAYRPHKPRWIQIIIATFAFNTTILFGSSLILANINSIFNLTGAFSLVVVLCVLGIYVYLISKLEELIDYPIYK